MVAIVLILWWDSRFLVKSSINITVCLVLCVGVRTVHVTRVVACCIKTFTAVAIILLNWFQAKTLKRNILPGALGSVLLTVQLSS